MSLAKLPFIPVPDCLFQTMDRLKNPTTSFAVLVALLKHSNRSYKPVWPSATHLATLLGISDKTVRRSLDDLEAAGFISVKERMGTSALISFTFDSLPEIQKQMASHISAHESPKEDIPNLSGTFLSTAPHVQTPGQNVQTPWSNVPPNQTDQPDPHNEILSPLLNQIPPQQKSSHVKPLKAAAADFSDISDPALPGTLAQRQYLVKQGIAPQKLLAKLKTNPTVDLSRLITRFDDLNSRTMIRSRSAWILRVLDDPEFAAPVPTQPFMVIQGAEIRKEKEQERKRVQEDLAVQKQKLDQQRQLNFDQWRAQISVNDPTLYQSILATAERAHKFGQRAKHYRETCTLENQIAVNLRSHWDQHISPLEHTHGCYA